MMILRFSSCVLFALVPTFAQSLDDLPLSIPPLPMPAVVAEDSASDRDDAFSSGAGIIPSSRGPASRGPGMDPKKEGVDWTNLMRQSLLFLAIEHGFRYATEPGTRTGMQGKFFSTYAGSVSNLHGWADGDPFYVNYVGHPMMGSVASNLFVQNDRKYRDVEFGKERAYWKSRLRATAFSFAYSTQFEMGPLSEATIGKVQHVFPQQGMVDYVVTPVIGTGWMLAEDALDKYLIKRVERWTTNSWARLLVRGGLNPTRSMANLLAWREPWYRPNRDGVYFRESYLTRRSVTDGALDEPVTPPPGVAPFEFSMSFEPQYFLGTGVSCFGGSGNAAFRIAPSWQIVVDVGGCKMAGLEGNLSGDSLTYLAGPRWKPNGDRRVSPHFQFLVGGRKITTEHFHPEEWKKLEPLVKAAASPALYRDRYTDRAETNNFAVSAGGGVDIKLNDALAFRLASLEYRHAWTQRMDGMIFSGGLHLTTGIVLRMGTW